MTFLTFLTFLSREIILVTRPDGRRHKTTHTHEGHAKALNSIRAAWASAAAGTSAAAGATFRAQKALAAYKEKLENAPKKDVAAGEEAVKAQVDVVRAAQIELINAEKALEKEDTSDIASDITSDIASGILTIGSGQTGNAGPDGSRQKTIQTEQRLPQGLHIDRL